MILIGHQPNYLPYIGFFHKLLYGDVYCVWDSVQFIKSGPLAWVHRNRIKTNHGWMWLTVPVINKFGQSIIDVEIDNSRDWSRKHWQSIVQNYKKAPHFNMYSDFFEEIYKKEWKKLSKLNETIIDYTIKELGMHIKVKRCSDYDFKTKRTDLIIEACRKLRADTFVFGVHGKDYAEEDKIVRGGISVVHQNFNHPVYKQQFQGFVPNMSIIDLLFNHGKNSLSIMRKFNK